MIRLTIAIMFLLPSFNDSVAQGDSVAAEQYLEWFKENPDSWPPLGVMHLIKGNHEPAYQHFPKTIDKGNTEAVDNMKELNRKKKNPDYLCFIF